LAISKTGDNHMARDKSSLVAWSVALASLALWAAGAPMSLGQVAPGDDTTAWLSAPCTAPSTEAVQPTVPTPFVVTPMGGVNDDGAFHLCGANPQVARSIEQLIGGRGFNATLSANGDGCADLAIHATSPASGSSRASSSLSVSLGSGANLSIQIVSEAGATHVSIGTAS
jgi:hypothetical protein